MKNQAFTRWFLILSAVAPLAGCAPQNEGGTVDMSIMMKAKEDMDQVKAGFQEMRGDLAKLGSRLETIESAVKESRTTAAPDNHSQITALLKELQGIKTALGEQSEQLGKLSSSAVAVAESPATPAGSNPAGEKPAPPTTTTTAAPQNPTGPSATEKVSVDMSTPGNKPAADKPASEANPGPLPFNEKVKVDLTK